MGATRELAFDKTCTQSYLNEQQLKRAARILFWGTSFALGAVAGIAAPAELIPQRFYDCTKPVR